ncbi:AAA family ATPase [Hypoxylon argillaceum]|nr:AAA family ATPase [Hypoxylon argillaceum]
MASHATAEIETNLENPSKDFSGKAVYHQSASRADDGHQGTKPLATFQDSLPGATERTIYTELMGRIASLEAENKKLKTANEAATQIRTLYWIMGRGSSGVYLSEPTLSIGPGGQVELTAQFPIPDILGFLSDNKHSIAFAVFRAYRREGQEKEVKAAVKADQPLPRPKHHAEAIFLNSQGMVDAAEAFFATQPKFEEEFPGLNIRAPLPAPYLFWYHYRTFDVSSRLSAHHQQRMQLLTSWIDANYGIRYDLVDQQLAEGLISSKSMPFLVKPGDVLVWEAKGEPHAVIAKSWPVQNDVVETKAWDLMGDIDRAREDGPAFRSRSTWKVDGWRYAYDGRLLREDWPLEIVLESKYPDDQIPIQDLSAYPLKFAKPRVAATLEKRGQTFWKCRQQKFVSYDNKKDANEAEERYMVDFETYKQFHSDSEKFRKKYPESDNPTRQYMGPIEMAANDPPPTPHIYVFPSTIPGYNMRNKTWIDLKVDDIKDITWNKQSFDHLALDSATKELLQTLIMSQIASEKGTDSIKEKGNGLNILLHGGPGTGKTFTAESIAELAEKPLLCATSGDIGIQPEEAEKYLEAVLYLRKVWGCIVLIDEADVFLEQRSLDNLEHNALVSIFLRVLEYSKGILILTSSRVSTFDETFRSRIHLSIHYDNLTTGQRTKIWKTFFSQLQTINLDGSSKTGFPTSASLRGLGDLSGSRKRKFEDAETGIDFDDVECFLGELAAFGLNGHQIRNAITAARQYASFKGVAMDHEHLKHVIEVSKNSRK